MSGRRWVAIAAAVALFFGTAAVAIAQTSGPEPVTCSYDGATLSCPLPQQTATGSTVTVTRTATRTLTAAPSTSSTRATTSSPPSTITPPAGAYPTASTTGAGSAPGACPTINTPGTYRDFTCTAGLTLNGPGITLQNCRVTGSGYAVINTRNAPGAVIRNCTIDGQGKGEGSSGVLGLFAEVSGSSIVGVENGVTPEGSDWLIQGNYIAALKAPGSPHYDGIQIDGGQSNGRILGNTVLNPFGQTSAVMIDNYFGPINNIVVDGNRLGGGGYTVYCDAQFTGGTISGVAYTNNHLVKGYWGYMSYNQVSPTSSGNVDDSTGARID